MSHGGTSRGNGTDGVIIIRRSLDATMNKCRIYLAGEGAYDEGAYDPAA